MSAYESNMPWTSDYPTCAECGSSSQFNYDHAPLCDDCYNHHCPECGEFIHSFERLNRHGDFAELCPACRYEAWGYLSEAIADWQLDYDQEFIYQSEYLNTRGVL